MIDFSTRRMMKAIIKTSKGGITVNETIFGHVMTILENYHSGTIGLGEAVYNTILACKLTKEKANSEFK